MHTSCNWKAYCVLSRGFWMRKFPKHLVVKRCSWQRDTMAFRHLRAAQNPRGSGLLNPARAAVLICIIVNANVCPWFSCRTLRHSCSYAGHDLPIQSEANNPVIRENDAVKGWHLAAPADEPVTSSQGCTTRQSDLPACFCALAWVSEARGSISGAGGSVALSGIMSAKDS